MTYGKISPKYARRRAPRQAERGREADRVGEDQAPDEVTSGAPLHRVGRAIGPALCSGSLPSHDDPPASRSLLLALALLASGRQRRRGSRGDERPRPPRRRPRLDTVASTAAAFRVGVVARRRLEDPRGALARVGLRRAEKLLRVDGRMVARAPAVGLDAEAHALRDRGLRPRDRGRGRRRAAVDNVARTFPDVDFAVVDASQQAQDAKPPNVRGLLFKEQQAGYLVGYLAGLLNAKEAGSKQTIGAVGGQKIPGSTGTSPGSERARGRPTPDEDARGLLTGLRRPGEVQGARARPDRTGADVVFEVAGRCGLGASAARRRTSGRSASTPTSAHLGDSILTSAVRGSTSRSSRPSRTRRRAASPAARTSSSTLAPAVSASAGERPGAGGHPPEGAGGPGRSRGREDHDIPEHYVAPGFRPLTT